MMLKSTFSVCRDCLIPKQKCFKLSLKLSLANVLLQRECSTDMVLDTETSVVEADVCPWYHVSFTC